MKLWHDFLESTHLEVIALCVSNKSELISVTQTAVVSSDIWRSSVHFVTCMLLDTWVKQDIQASKHVVKEILIDLCD